MKRIPTLFACLLVAHCAQNGVSAEGDAPKVALQYKFAAGQILRYAVDNDSKINIQVGDVGGAVQHESHSEKQFQVLEVREDGSAVLQVTVDYVRMSADNQGEKVAWDSRADEEPPEAFAGIGDTIGKPWGTITLSPRGAVSDVALKIKGIEATSLQELHLDVLPALPEEPVAVGDSWKEPFEVEVFATPTLKKKISLQRIYVLKSVEDGIATIDERTVVLSPVQDPMQEGQLIQRTPSGTVTIDIERGLLLQRDLKIDNRVVGFQGPQTALEVAGARAEALIEQTAAADQPVPR